MEKRLGLAFLVGGVVCEREREKSEMSEDLFGMRVSRLALDVLKLFVVCVCVCVVCVF